MKVLVDNASKMAITYTRGRKTTQSEMLDTAEKLSKLIKMDTKKITERDKKDFWIQLHPKKAKAMMTKEQAMLADGSIKQDQNTINNCYRKSENHKLDELSSKDLEVLAIFREMNAGTVLDPQMIKNEDVSEKEYGAVSQQLSNYQVLTLMDWDRKYPYGDTLRGIFGDVSTPAEVFQKN